MEIVPLVAFWALPALSLEVAAGESLG